MNYDKGKHLCGFKLILLHEEMGIYHHYIVNKHLA